MLEKYERLPEWLRWILFLPLVITLPLLIGLLLSWIREDFTIIASLVAILSTLQFTKWLAPRWKNQLMMLGLTLRTVLDVGILATLFVGEAPGKQAWLEMLREAISLPIGFVVYFKLLRETKVEKEPVEKKLATDNKVEKIPKLTMDDFVPRVHAWTKISRYALTGDGYLIRFDGTLSDGFPVFECLFEGWWEVTDVCVGIRDVKEAKPITEDQAKKIIQKEEKPLNERPKERNSWLNC